jgi:hypothetical protein
MFTSRSLVLADLENDNMKTLFTPTECHAVSSNRGRDPHEHAAAPKVTFPFWNDIVSIMLVSVAPRLARTRRLSSD